MVNRGRSGGCVTCKERRVKCDEARPKCQACQRLRLHCGGYRTQYASVKFKDQNHKFPVPSVIQQNRAYSLRPLSEPDTAVPFYLHYYAGIGRETSSARGFFEVLIPVYCSQRQNSALSLAVSAVASRVLSIWRHDNSPRPQEAYAQAVKCLRRTIQDPREWGNPATMLAVLSLQLFESVVAVYGLRPSTQIHHNGAVSFLPFAHADNNSNESASASVRRFILHAEICSAIRQGRQVQTIASSWIGDNGLCTSPDNPSAALDAIGVSVARLQANHLKLGLQSGSTTLSPEALSECMAETRRVDQQLLTWAQYIVPDHWLPLKLTDGWNVDSSIPIYQSTCEIYPSCQIAAIWNLWRIQRILIVKIKLSLLEATLNTWRACELECDDGISSNLPELAELQHVLQELVDGVCYSVPFHLGNLSKPGSIADFADPTILFPSSRHDRRAVVDEHRCHLIAQGPWQIMSPLSRLLAFCFEEHGPPMRAFFRPGQYEWIRDQFLRVTMLLHIPPMEASDHYEGGSLDTMAKNLAAGVRKGAIFMSGP